MRLRVAIFLFSALSGAALWACGLNPQPIPPDTVDAGADGAMVFGPDAAGGVPDGSSDDGTTPSSGDASVDAMTDASDASVDGSEDASDGSVTDATEDGG